MGLSNGITVRLPDELRARVARVAVRAGLQPADLIRAALSDYVDRVETEGRVTITLSARVAEAPAEFPVAAEPGAPAERLKDLRYEKRHRPKKTEQ
jgi:predicted transcriptional regulator